jgi:hypothetical protein
MEFKEDDEAAEGKVSFTLFSNLQTVQLYPCASKFLRFDYLEYDGDKNNNNVPDVEEIGVNYLEGDGDFRSKESIELLKQADIVVTARLRNSWIAASSGVWVGRRRSAWRRGLYGYIKIL